MGGGGAVQAEANAGVRGMSADVHFHEGSVGITIDKAIIVISRQAFVEGLKRGKQWRRRQAMAARLARLAQEPRSPVGEGGGDTPGMEPRA
jgi:hypothetical protein